MSPTFRALRVRNFRLYALGGVISNTGTWMQRVAQDWLVLQLFATSAAGASTALGVTTGLQFLPILLLSTYAGVVADLMPKRRLLIMTQLWMGASSLALGALAILGYLQPWLVFSLVFVFGIGAAFDAPARQAFVSEMVAGDDLSNAVGLNSASFNLARLVGPAAAGLLIAVLGGGVVASGVVILLNGLSYVAVILALRAMDTRSLAPMPVTKAETGMVRDGLAYVWHRPDLMLILTAAFFAGTFGMNYQMTSALMATQVYHLGAGEYGILGTTLAIGSLTGALLSARRVGRPRLKLVVLAGLAFGFIEIALGLMPSYLTFALVSPLLGLSLLIMLNAANTTVQLSVHPMIRGRVMALYLMVVMGGTPLGAPLIGWIGATLGARWTLIAGGGVTVLGVALAVALFHGLGRRGPLVTSRVAEDESLTAPIAA